MVTVHMDRGRDRPIRQFDGNELISLLDYLDARWKGVPIGATTMKIFLWSACRKLEVTGLIWDSLRLLDNECHFEITGKWGIEKWFRIPESVYQELLYFRTTSPFVFAAYNNQLRHFHAGNPNWLRNIRPEFSPREYARWIYQRVKEWSITNPKGPAFVHVFRKTTLQYARQGEDINQQIARDTRVSESVLMTNYVKETDEEMRQRSNRTYRRISASLPTEVARRYGHVEEIGSELENRLRIALSMKNWPLVSQIAAQLEIRSVGK